MAQDVDDVDTLSGAISVVENWGQRIQKPKMSIRTDYETRQNKWFKKDWQIRYAPLPTS